MIQLLTPSETALSGRGTGCAEPVLDSNKLTYSYRRVGPEGLPLELVKAWRTIQNSNPNLGSPYFSPEFTNAAAASRNDTEVVIAFHGDTPVAFLPFHRVSPYSAFPIGGAINDYHGVISPPTLTGCLERLVEAAGLKRFDFHSMWYPLDEATRWAVDDQITETSANIAGTGEDYRQQLPQKSRTIWKQGQKTRKMIRELGPLRFEMHDPDPARLEWLIRLKREKYRRTDCTDFFKPEWSRKLLAQLNMIQSADFRGVMSVLYAGDHLVAGHFGIATETVLHYWYPAFDTRYAIYSPGTEFYLQLVQQSIAQGIRRIDFGYGEEPFKMKLTNQQGRLACGCIGASAIQLQSRKLIYNTHQRIKRSRFRTLIRDTVRTIWPGAGKTAVR